MFFTDSILAYNAVDAVISVILLAVLTFLARLFYTKKVKGKTGEEVYWAGYWAGIIGGQIMLALSLTLVISGDMQLYFTSSRSLWYFALNHFEAFEIMLDIVYNNADAVELDPYINIRRQHHVGYLQDGRAFFTNLMTMPFTLLGGMNLYNATLVVSVVSFFARWLLFRVFVMIVPLPVIITAACTIFMPTLLSWTAIIFKETFSFIALCLFVYIFIKPTADWTFVQRIRYYTLAVLSVIVILNIKSYIIYSLMPFLLYYKFGYNFISKFNTFQRVIISSVGFSTVIGVLMLVLNLTSGGLGEYSLDALAETTASKGNDLQSNYYYVEQDNDSRYNLGKIDPTIVGIIQKFPIATFTCLFRPLPYDINSVQIAMSSAESTVIFIVFLLVIFRVGVFRAFKYLVSNPLIFSFLMFSIVYAFFVGLSAGNFGNLVRYRAPMMPFFSIGVISLYAFYLEEIRVKKERQFTEYLREVKRRQLKSTGE